MSKRKSPAGLESTMLDAIARVDALTAQLLADGEQPAAAPVEWTEAVGLMLQEAVTVPDEYPRCALVIALCELGRLWCEWVNTPIEDAPKMFAGWPPHEWFGQFDVVKKLVKSPVAKRPEPVAELVRQKVAPAQIARIWGLVLENGEADLPSINREIAQPGSVITESFVPSFVRDRLRIAEQLQRDVAALLATLVTTPEERGEQPEFIPPHESIEQLIEQGVSYKQIAAMHGVPVDEVKARHEAMQSATAGA